MSLEALRLHAVQNTSSFLSVTIETEKEEPAIGDLEQETPLLLITPVADFASDPDRGGCSQEVTEEFAFWIVCKGEQLRALKKELRDAVLGFQFEQTDTGLALAHEGGPAGQVMKLEGEFVWWTDRYWSRHHTTDFNF